MATAEVVATPVQSDRGRQALALVVFGALVAAEIGYVLASRGLATRPDLAHQGPVNTGEVLGTLSVGALGLVLSWMRPRNPIGWLLSATALLLTLCNLGQAYGGRALVIPSEHLPLGALALSLSAPLWLGTVFLPVTVILLRYPTGRIEGRWGRRLDRVVWVALGCLFVGYATSPESVTDEAPGHLPPLVLPAAVRLPLAVTSVLLLVGATLLIIGHTAGRAIRSDPRERAAILLLLAASITAAVVIFAAPTGGILGSLAYAGVLVAVAVGVLRYQALGIEVVVRRTLLYVILTGLVLVAFIGVTTLLARLVPAGPTPQIIAASLIAVGLAPSRDRVQRLVDHLLYGERGDPAAALKRLGSSMGDTPSDGLLLAVTANIAEVLRLDGAEIVDETGEVVATWGAPDAGTSLPLTFAGEALGHLRVGRRRGETALGRADRQLLDTVTPLIAAVVHADRLTADLTAERNRVVGATQAERRRLRQELHDGLGPSLTGIGLGLEAAAARPLAEHDPGSAELLGRLRTEVAAALDETRRIIEDLRPVSLDGSDLFTALRRRVELAGASGIAFTTALPGSPPVLTPDLETALFRIADEALTNVVRHSGAHRCTVRLDVGDTARLVIEDDGVGIVAREPRTGPGGVGLGSMRERAERLGGHLEVSTTGHGTKVVAEIPLLRTREVAP